MEERPKNKMQKIKLLEDNIRKKPRRPWVW